MRAASRQNYFFNDSAAAYARLTGSTVDGVLDLKEAGSAVGAAVVA